MLKASIYFTFAFALVSTGAASAADWATLTGRFIYDGKAPAQKRITPDKDVQVCSKHQLFEESLVVSSTGGVKNVVVFLRTARVKEHPSYAQTASEEVVLDNANCRFEPHVQILRTTQTLVIKNSDPVGHNTNVQGVANSFNPIVPANGDVKKKFTAEERLPAKVSCNIHPWMSAYLIIRKSPYMAVSNDNGEFVIENLPVGKELEFQLWQEKAGYLKGLSGLKGAKVDSKGRMKIKLKSGINDLGSIKVKAASFK